MHVRSLERGEEKRARKSLELTTNRRRRRRPIWDRCLLSQEQTRERREEKTRFLAYCLSQSSSAPALWQKGGTAPEHSCGKMELGFEAWLPLPSLCLSPLLSLSPEFFHPNSSAALLNLRALEVAWTGKQAAGWVEVPERLS